MSSKAVLDRWWRSAVKYPAADVQFRATDHYDLLRSMRAMIRLMCAGIAVLVGMVVLAVAGYGVPGWTSGLLGPVAVAVMFATTPTARHTLSGIVLSSVRRKWSDTWSEADVPLTRLWMMTRSPVTPTVFAEYATALNRDTSAMLDGGTDPRVVWALVARTMSLARVAEYRKMGLNAAQGVILTDHNISPGDWGDLGRAGVANDGRFEQVLRFVTWARTSRASLHPDQFAVPPPTRTVTDVLPTMRAWVLHRGFTARAEAPCARTDGESLPCDRCGGTVKGGHRAWFVNARAGSGKSVGEWTTMAGLLAPHFLAARIGFDEAAQMVASSPSPTVDDLVFLAAWGEKK